MHNRVFLGAAGVLFAVAAQFACAQAYPVKPIRFLIPLPPGGNLDLVARITGTVAEKRLGQPIVYDNRPGASTIVASELCAKAAPDGYTVCMLTSTLTTLPFLYKKLPFDPQKDFEPITNLAIPHEGFYLTGKIPASNLRELVEYSKSNPGKVFYGSLGAGGGTHLTPEWVSKFTGAGFTHVPYKGFPDLFRDFLGGEVHIMVVGLTQGIIENIKAGRAKVLFFPGSRRNGIFPDVPTMAEAGVPDPGFRAWWGLGGPARMPREIVQRLNTAFVEALRSPEVVSRFAAQSFDPAPDTPEAFGRFMREDRARAEPLIKAAGVQPE